MTIEQLIFAYNKFCDDCTPQFIKGLLQEIENVTVPEIEVVRLYHLALFKGEAPTIDDFNKSLEFINNP